MNLKTGRVVTRQHFTIVAITQEVIDRVNQLGRQDRQPDDMDVQDSELNIVAGMTREDYIHENGSSHEDPEGMDLEPLIEIPADGEQENLDSIEDEHEDDDSESESENEDRTPKLKDITKSIATTAGD